MIKENVREDHVTISEDLEGNLVIPAGTQAIVLFAHGSGSDRYSIRNRFVANSLNKRSIATLVVNLLNPQEKRIDEDTKHLRYDIELLARRFKEVTEWLAHCHETKALEIGYFGSSTGAAAALITAERLGIAKAIVTRGGRPDLVDETTLSQITAPT
ncbi:MAG: dienelactone hydrolase family protein, partial [Nitrososphaera sp.]